MTNLTEAFDTAVKNVKYWENGELMMGDVYIDLGEQFSDMDPADFEYEFVQLESEYMDFAYEDEKIIMTLMLQDSDGYACLGNQV